MSMLGYGKVQKDMCGATEGRSGRTRDTGSVFATNIVAMHSARGFQTVLES